MNVRPKTST